VEKLSIIKFQFSITTDEKNIPGNNGKLKFDN